jgi:PEP-CTERM motif-containing protein
MATKRRTDPKRRKSGRRDLAAVLMMLLPGFMFLGLLAPGAVKIQPIEQDEIGPISFRQFAPRRPYNVPLTMAHALLPDTSMAGMEPAFSGARYLADQARRVFEPDVAAQAKNQEQEIVLAQDDSVHSYVAAGLFDDSLEGTVLVADLTPLWDPSVFDVIPGLIMRSGYSQWDDFHGTGVSFHGIIAPTGPVVPEPETGALVSLGLAALALRGRR